MNKKITFYLCLAIGFLSHVGFAQTLTKIDVTPNGSSEISDKQQIGNELYFINEDDATSNEYLMYMNESGEVRKPVLVAPQNFTIDDSYAWDIVNVNNVPYWVQEIYDDNLGEYLDFIASYENDTIQFLTPDSVQIEQLFLQNGNMYVLANNPSQTFNGKILAFDGQNLTIVSSYIGNLTGNGYVNNISYSNGNVFLRGFDYSANVYFMTEFDGTSNSFTDTITYGDIQYFDANGETYFAKTYSNPSGIYKWNNGNIDTVLFFNSYNQTSKVTYADDAFYLFDFIGGNSEIYKYDLITETYDTIPAQYSLNSEPVLFQNEIYFTSPYNASSPWTYNLQKLNPLVDTIETISITNQLGSVYTLEVLGNELYFEVESELNGENIGEEPFRYNNGNPVLIADVNPGEYNDSDPYDFVLYNNQLVFNMYDEVIESEIAIMCVNGNLPTAPSTQIACSGIEIQDLNVTGEYITYYSDANSTAELSETTSLNQSGSVFVSTNFICPSARVEVPFTVSVLPNPAAAYFGDSLIKVLNTTATYQWVDCATDIAIAGQTSQTLNVPGNGSYSCILTNADGCENITNCIYVVNLSVDENLKNTISVYPNPANDLIHLISSEEMAKIEVLTITGELVLTEKVSTTNFKMNTTNLSEGIYIIVVSDANNTIVSKQKLMVSH